STLLTITGIKNRVKYARERLVISQSGLFDRSWYLENYPDVRSAGIDPLRHFIIYGWREYRNPSATFNVYNYLQSYPEVLAAGSCPLMHYIKNPVLEV
ncbi:MAG: hypothetical protein KC713_10200, partial [Candidatus Omnitrophica bacterium]|nr:hypothetical protein [Candidatus Omnitrophota bacterium]